MIDLLLKFPDKQTAGLIGEALGCAKKQGEEWIFATTHKVAICPIGEHYRYSGINQDSVLGPIPVMLPDGKFWALARILADIPVPEALTPFIVERNPNDLTQPQHQWA